MIRVSIRNILLFFILVSLIYVLAPITSEYIFDIPYESNLTYLLYACTILFLIILSFFSSKKIIIFYIPYMKPVLSPILGIVLFSMIVWCCIKIYGSLENAFFISYGSRTGVAPTGLVKIIFYPVLSVSTSYVSIVLVNLTSIKDMQKTFSAICSYVIAFCIILIFVVSGNRNLILWSLGLPLAVFIGRSKFITIFLLTNLLIFLSILLAAERGLGFNNIENFQIPKFEYWNPMGHEYSTTYRMFAVLENSNLVISGYDYPLSSYLEGAINFLPSFLKPDNYQSFSDRISTQLGSNGEGLGNSPVGEVYYNGIFPAIVIQIMPFYLVLVFLKILKKNSLRANFSNLFKMSLLASLIIMSFNFWRIGFAELVKIIISYNIGYIICGFLAFKKNKSENIFSNTGLNNTCAKH